MIVRNRFSASDRLAELGRFVRLPLILLIAVLISGCNPTTDKPIAAEPQLSYRVVAVSYPLQFLTQQIAGDKIKVEFPAANAESLHSWRPTREQILEMQSADLVVANGTGATYANWLKTIALADSKMCLTASRGLSLRDYVQIEQVVHSHGPEGEHSHASMVGETWLDPRIAMKQAKYICKSLSKTYPEKARQFEENLKALSAKLTAASERLEAIKARSSDKEGDSGEDNSEKAPTLISTSPGLKFLTRAAGISDYHLSWQHEPSLEEAKADLEKAMATFGDQKPTTILVANGPLSDEISRLFQELELKPVSLSTIEQASSDGDYLTSLDENISKLDGLRN